MCPDTVIGYRNESPNDLELATLPGAATDADRPNESYPQSMSLPPPDPLPPGGCRPRTAALRFSQPRAGFARLPRCGGQSRFATLTQFLLAGLRPAVGGLRPPHDPPAMCYPCARSKVLPMSRVAQRGDTHAGALLSGTAGILLTSLVAWTAMSLVGVRPNEQNVDVAASMVDLPLVRIRREGHTQEAGTMSIRWPQLTNPVALGCSSAGWVVFASDGEIVHFMEGQAARLIGFNVLTGDQLAWELGGAEPESELETHSDAVGDQQIDCRWSVGLGGFVLHMSSYEQGNYYVLRLDGSVKRNGQLDLLGRTLRFAGERRAATAREYGSTFCGWETGGLTIVSNSQASVIGTDVIARNAGLVGEAFWIWNCAVGNDDLIGVLVVEIRTKSNVIRSGSHHPRGSIEFVKMWFCALEWDGQVIGKWLVKEWKQAGRQGLGTHLVPLSGRILVWAGGDLAYLVEGRATNAPVRLDLSHSSVLSGFTSVLGPVGAQYLVDAPSECGFAGVALVPCVQDAAK